MMDRPSFFPTRSEDLALESANAIFWDVLIDIVESDRDVGVVKAILDVGSHSGAFLERVIRRWYPSTVYGIEPVAALREEALQRLKDLPLKTFILGAPDGWNEIADTSIDLVCCQEVFYLVDDVPEMLRRFARVLKPGGAAYITLGCHTENPLWPRWREVLVQMGLEVWDHSPMEILRAAESAGFWTAVRPLRRDGWIIHAPSTTLFSVPDIKSLMDHHYRHKLLFRLEL